MTAEASSIRARAFFPVTPLSVSARCAWTVVRRSSNSSTSHEVASAIAWAVSRARRAASPSVPRMSSGNPTTIRPMLSSSTRARSASSSAGRGLAASAPRGCAIMPSSSVTATPTRTAPRSSAHTAFRGRFLGLPEKSCPTPGGL